MPRKNNRAKQANPNHPLIVLILVTLLLLIGIIMVFDASVVEAFYRFNDKFHFVRSHLVWVVISIIAMLVASRFPLNTIRRISPYAFLTAIVFLIAVLIPYFSVEINGARRWLNLGFMTFQPSEFTKLATMIYLPSWLVYHQRLPPFLMIVGSTLGLLMLEPDLGTAIIIAAIALSMYFVSGAPLKSVMSIIIVGGLIGALLITSSPYRRQRLATFLDPNTDPLGSSYHIRQVLISLGSGGMTGTGIGKSRQKYQYLPEASTDSIFAVIGEELGFIGAATTISLYSLLLYQLFALAKKIKDNYAHILAIGGIVWIGTQTFLNIAAMVALVPLTGVPLPLISYGGSSMVTIMVALGLILNASRY